MITSSVESSTQHWLSRSTSHDANGCTGVIIPHSNSHNITFHIRRVIVLLFVLRQTVSYFFGDKKGFFFSNEKENVCFLLGGGFS